MSADMHVSSRNVLNVPFKGRGWNNLVVRSYICASTTKCTTAYVLTLARDGFVTMFVIQVGDR